MMRLVIMMLWCTSGVVAAMALSPRQTGRFAWAPAAAILGPMWVAVALEQEVHNR